MLEFPCAFRNVLGNSIEKPGQMRQKVEDLSSQLQTQAAQQFRMPDMGAVMSKSDVSAAAQADEKEEEDDDERRRN
ncbi:hypothetical protein L1987_13022 [Smallanthus sonchifolius]|uniref:Uncharacterized protein n=1 Tax=Smallanthus sonchifolius TaxID=185202 RepID=A0ACB9JGD2_9ASTR|nr:hypothetical protein L1987_13022 [Smallanthus sonchifolius]